MIRWFVLFVVRGVSVHLSACHWEEWGATPLLLFDESEKSLSPILTEQIKLRIS